MKQTTDYENELPKVSAWLLCIFFLLTSYQFKSKRLQRHYKMNGKGSQQQQQQQN